MAESITVQTQRLGRMTVSELQQEHIRLYGKETKSRHKQQLFRRLSFRVQELAFGGLSERTKLRANEIANDIDARFLPPRKLNGSEDGPHEILPVRVSSAGTHPAPGTIITREYRGEVHQVTVLEGGTFEYRGHVFRSLSGIAKAITGTVWSGPLFFGLRKREKRS